MIKIPLLTQAMRAQNIDRISRDKPKHVSDIGGHCKDAEICLKCCLEECTGGRGCPYVLSKKSKKSKKLLEEQKK